MNPLALIGFAFGGGLVASISPCCLSMLPINLSYIGSQSFADKKDALVKAASFVIGVTTTLSLLGLFSGFATLVLVRYRSFIMLAVGLLILLMGLSLLNLIYVPFSRLGAQSHLKGLGPFGVGLSFGLVGSPCATPIMLTVLGVAASTGNQLMSVAMMSAYSLGYSLLIFTCCLLTGLAKQAKGLKNYSSVLTKIAGMFLIGMGVFYSVNGLYFSVKRFL